MREDCHYQVHSPLLNKLQPTFAAATAMPPCAVQPFLGLATYFAPLCYVIKQRASLYTMSRLLYCQLWCRLNVLSSDPNTLLPVCKLFEVLLLQMQPRLFMHLVNIGLQPLKVCVLVVLVMLLCCCVAEVCYNFVRLFATYRWRFRGFNWASWVCWKWTSCYSSGTES